MTTIFHIENRGSNYIGHFIIFMIGGLRHIINKTFDRDKQENHHGGSFEHNVFNKNIDLQYPIKIYIQGYNHEENLLNNEILCAIKDKFELIHDLTPYLNDNNCQIINNHGEPNEPNTSKEVHHFLRSMFLIQNYPYDNTKYIYISRNNSHLLIGNKSDNNVKRRQILNETELINKLTILNFKIIQLEDYNFQQKIELFNTSSIILSPQGGCLTFSLFANENTNIIEICPLKPKQYCNQYKQMCESLNLKWERYSNILNIDSFDNMTVNVGPLYRILKNKIKQINKSKYII